MLAPRPLYWIVACVVLVMSAVLYQPAKRAIACEVYQRNNSYRNDVMLNFQGQPIQAERVKTDLDRQKGLSGRECIRKNQAMLFEFDADDVKNHCFWMKDMKFPIDIYWLDSDKRVVFSATQVKPSSYPKSYCPNVQTRFVIELHSGIGKELLFDYDDVAPF